MADSFYKAFEARHRGSRETIKTRLAQYETFVTPLLSLGGSNVALDLGCGRGEWLEIAGERGFCCRGVDLDEGMLEDCLKNNLSAQKRDAIEAIQEMPDHSVALVTGFHIVEHIPFEKLQALFREAFRVLVPGGLLILETPNPENIVVATTNFYLDPTHIRPIPPPLLTFLSEFNEFYRSRIVRLQGGQSLTEKSEVTTKDIFTGVSPDYALVAQKGGAADVLAQFDKSFAEPFGVSLSQILGQLDRSQKEKEGALNQRVYELEQKLAQMEVQLHSAPFIRMSKVLRSLFDFGPQSKNRRLARIVFDRLFIKLTGRPKMRAVFVKLIGFIPLLQRRAAHLSIFAAPVPDSESEWERTIRRLLMNSASEAERRP